MIESESHGEEPFFADWVAEEEDLGSTRPTWRKPVLIAVATITAIAMALIPIYNVVFATRVADNGLEICGFDYCVVQEAVRGAGLDLTMSRLANTILVESEARDLANELTDYLGTSPVGLSVVEDLDGRLGGLYDPGARSISIESPARAWTVLHEVAHAVESGHGPGFRDVLIDLASYLSASRSSA